MIIAATASSQTILLEVDRGNELKNTTHGQNLKIFNQGFIRTGMLASNDFEGAQIIYGSSVNLAIGFRKKYKISGFYSMGFEIESEYTDYKLKQEKGKMVPDTIINNISERLDYYSLGLGFYQRFNFDPGRGNFLGSFLDIGISGQWHYSIKDISKNNQPDGTVVKNVTKKLPFVDYVDAKAYARLGFSKVSLYGSYRLTDLFKPSWNFPDMPRVVLGLELSFF